MNGPLFAISFLNALVCGFNTAVFVASRHPLVAGCAVVNGWVSGAFLVVGVVGFE